ncbi:MAG: diacylglycerol kinase [Deltaproteobacteria bacterium]|nr:diacylglycerol kinase [Deltaproteobacteria bacterium]
MTTIGTGKGFAALLNGRARKVTPAVVRAFTKALPEATLYVSEDLEQARRHVRSLIAQRPEVVFSGGGDGAAMRILNLWREEGGGAFPTIAVLRLGTGNGWGRVMGAPEFFPHVKKLHLCPRALPTQQFDLVEVEGQLGHFAGVGWDARVINDYLRNLDKRSSQMVGSSFASWLHKGVRGYLYSIARITVPEEYALLRDQGQATVTVENQGNVVYGLDAAGALVELHHPSGSGPMHQLYEGPLSVGAAATTPEWGYGFKAFPFARAKSGFINVRVYDQPVLKAVRNVVGLWQGRYPTPGMHDWFTTQVKMRFSRPMPFQIGGDGLGQRQEIVMRVAKESVNVVDWRAALAGT